MKLDQLVARGEALHAELGREYYLAGAGLKAEPAFQAIYERYSDLITDEALAAARAAGEPALLEWAVDLRVGRRVASLEETQLRWEQATVLQVGGRQIPYLRAAIELQNEPDRAARIALDDARLQTAATGLAPIRRERLVLERAVVLQACAGPDYVTVLARLMGIDLGALGRAADQFLVATEDLYRDALGRLVRRRLAVPLGDLVRADTAWVFRANRFDPAFPSDRLVPTATRQMAEMGLDATCAGRVQFDTEERAGKQSRAFCVPVHVPDEVHLVLRPAGGHGDYRTFWHELGHAMHYASVEPQRPFHQRWLGDTSVTEGFAMLWDHLTLEPGWLARYSGLEHGGGPHGREIRELGFELAVSELYMVRRYAAKLGYELELHRSDYDGLGPRYAERLSEATKFRFAEQDSLIDVDPGFYAARYLRAWQLEALLSRTLGERFDVDWYRNPKAGAMIADLMSRGQAAPADRLAQDASGQQLSFTPIVERLTHALA